MIDEDKCWKFRGDEFPGGNEGLGERLSFKVKAKRWGLIPGEESNFHDGRRKLITFSSLW